MSGSDVRTIYRGIIDEVVTNSRPEFVQEGVDEAVLDELRILWEEKLQQSGVLAAPPIRPLLVPGAQYPTPVSGGFQYLPTYYSHTRPAAGAPLGQPSFHAPQSTVPWQQPQGQHPPAGGQYRPQQTAQPRPYPPASQPLAVPLQSNNGQGGASQARQYTSALASAQYNPHVQKEGPRPQTQSNPALQNAAQPTVHKPNPEALLAYLQHISSHNASGGERPAYPQLPQHYAAAIQGLKTEAATSQPLGLLQPRGTDGQAASSAYSQAGNFPIWPVPARWQVQAISEQQQGFAALADRSRIASGDLAGQKRKAEFDQANGRAKQHQQGGGGIVQLDGSDGGSQRADEEKGESEEAAEVEDKLSDVPSSNEAEEEIPNQCLSQFTKVQRTKNRWKCQLLAGVLNLNGRDHVFNQASGEFQF